MKTEVIMKRELFGRQISQKHKSGYLNATELVAAGNFYRNSKGLSNFKLQDFLERDSTKEFVKSLKATRGIEPKTASRGRNGGTWVHPLLFIDIALAISPELKVEVYDWIFDELLSVRDGSGDSYKKMTGYLYANHSNKKSFGKFISSTCALIQKSCRVPQGDEKWETASEDQLRLRDKIHNNISILANVLRDNGTAVRCGIKQALDDQID